MGKYNKKNGNKIKNGNLFKIVSIYLSIIFLVLPLIYHNYYFDILTFKYNTFINLSEIFIVMFVLLSLYEIYKGNIKIRDVFKNIKLDFNDIFMIVFFLSALVGALISPYQEVVYIGQQGRFNGLMLFSFYFILYFIIKNNYKTDSKIIYFFLFSGLTACIIGITDYFRLDLLDFRVRMKPEQKDLFMSTLGNINIYAGFLSFVFAVSSSMFVMSQKSEKNKNIIYYIISVISIFALIMSNSDSAYLSLFAFFGFLPVFAFKKLGYFKKYSLLVFSAILSVKIIGLIQGFMGDKVILLGGVFSFISNSFMLYIILFIALAVTIFTYFVIKEDDNYKVERTLNYLSYVWIACAILFIVLLISSIVFFSINGDFYNLPPSLKNYLIFSDSWGTNRGFVWKAVIQGFAGFDFIHKLFGLGPETVMQFLVDNRYDEMVNITGSIFDASHNEFLNYLFTQGIIGLVSYILLTAGCIYNGIKSSKNMPDTTIAINVALTLSVICYVVQSAVNLYTPIETPFLFIFIAMSAGICKKYK